MDSQGKPCKRWKRVKLFISSTFKDMHAERDHLVRHVFNDLKEKCRKIRVELIDVDLRWGVTEKDAQDGKALDICLDEIEIGRECDEGAFGMTPSVLISRVNSLMPVAAD